MTTTTGLFANHIDGANPDELLRTLRVVGIRLDVYVATRLNLTRLLVVIHRVRMHNDRTYAASVGMILTWSARNNSHFDISAQMKNGRAADRHVALCA
jgi:hypothetical protein